MLIAQTMNLNLLKKHCFGQIQLPEILRLGLQSYIKETGLPKSELTVAVNQLSSSLRSRGVPALTTAAYADPTIAAAYSWLRMPTTFGCCVRVLRELRSRRPQFRPATVLDFGSGPGSAMFAAASVWDLGVKKSPLFTDPMTGQGDNNSSSNSSNNNVSSGSQGPVSFTCIEPSAPFERVARRLVRDSGLNARVVWNRYPDRKEKPVFDLVVASFVVGEQISGRKKRALVRQLWAKVAATGGCLVLVEPGTPAGFESIMDARDAILNPGPHFVAAEHRSGGSGSGSSTNDDGTADAGGVPHLLAPCPHAADCPLTAPGVNSWCHFSQRIQYQQNQRVHLKYEADGTTLRSGARGPTGRRQPQVRNWSNEKFCYMVFEKRPSTDTTVEDDADADGDAAAAATAAARASSPPEQRVIRHPLKRGRHVIMDLCKTDGTAARHIISKRKAGPVLYRSARKSQWGDSLAVDLDQLPAPLRLGGSNS